MKRRQGGRKKCHFFLSLKVIISILGPFHYCPVSLLTVLCMACKSIVFINISPCTKFFLVAMTYHLSNGKENYNNLPYKKNLGIFLQGSHLVEQQNMHYWGIFERSEHKKKFRDIFFRFFSYIL